MVGFGQGFNGEPLIQVLYKEVADLLDQLGLLGTIGGKFLFGIWFQLQQMQQRLLGF